MTVACDTILSEQIAAHFNGRRIGGGRWIARCPAHPDKSPSLSIASGRDGKVLLRCFAGCSLDSVLQAAGLALANLFPGPPPSAEKLAAIAAERVRKYEAERDWNTSTRRAVDFLRTLRESLTALLPIVAPQLMKMPLGAPGEKVLTAYFHDSLAKVRLIDRAFEGEAEWSL